MTQFHKITAVFFLLCSTQQASALEDITLPFATEGIYQEVLESVSYPLPFAPFKNGTIPFLSVDGTVERMVLKINSDAPVFEMANIFRNILREQRYTELFHCHDETCGGFDFRARLDIASAPAIYVDLRNFHFVAAERLGEQETYVALIISRSEAAGFVQIDIASGTSERSQTKEASMTVVVETPGDYPIDQQFEISGRAILDKLEFESGSPHLGQKNYPQLQALAAYLEAEPDARILLVGHTDSKGSREANLELSEQRAKSVADRLIKEHGVDPVQISAEGIGSLAPRTTNNTSEGRQLNRRVEAVLIPSEE